MKHPANHNLYQRTKTGINKHWIGAVIAVVMSTITGTIVPMIEQWHSDNVVSSQISKVESNLSENIKDTRNDNQKDIDSINIKIGKLYKRISEDEIALASHNIIVYHKD